LASPPAREDAGAPRRRHWLYLIFLVLTDFVVAL
jgi:hypothetical protein